MTSADLYPWLKALHVAAAITFVGGVLGVAVYLTTLTVATRSPGQQHATQIVRRWDRAVTTPAMLLVWALGLALALWGGWLSSGWLRSKLVLVLVLSALHGVQSGALRRAAGGSDDRPRVLRAAGPIVLGLVLAIAILVVVKPF